MRALMRIVVGVVLAVAVDMLALNIETRCMDEDKGAESRLDGAETAMKARPGGGRGG